MADEQLFGVAVEETPLFGEPVVEEDEYDPTEYEGVAQEFGEGILSGATKVVQGVAELGAIASDYLADTDYYDDVGAGFEEFRQSLGIDPQGFAGAIGEVGTQFVVPGGIAAKGVQGLNAVAKAGKTGKFFAGLGAAGLADAVVATNDTTTLGDFFEGGPTETGELIGLDNEERALEALLNKAKVGVEGAAGIVAAPFVARGLGAAASGAATAAGQIPGATQAARGIKAGAEKVGAKFGEIEEARRLGLEQSPFLNGVADAMATLRYRGILPQEVAESRSLIPGLTQAEVQAADKLVNMLDKEIDSVLKVANQNLEDATPFAKADVYNSIEKYLTNPNRAEADTLLKSFPDQLQAPVKQMRTHLDELSGKLLESDFIKKNDFYQKETKKMLSETIRGNLGSYMTRRYRMFEDPNFKPTTEMMDEAAAGFKADPVAVQNELELLAKSGKRSVQELGLTDDFKLLGQVTDDQARIARDNFLDRYKKSTGKTFKGVSRVGEQRLRTDQFITRTNLKEYQRALLGEVKNPLENYVATVSNIAEFNAVDNYFGNIRRLAEENPDGIGKLFRNTEGMSPDQLKALEEEGFVTLGSARGSSRADKSIEETVDNSGWGSLHGFAVPERVYQDLTRAVVGDTGWLGNGLRSIYSGFLRVKGGTQYGKTILSPITQIRNVTTASAFAAAQGNIGKGANLWESVGLVFNNLRKMPPEKAAEEFKELQRLGIVNSQAELRELQELVAKGFGYTDQRMVEGIPVTERFGSRLSDNKVMDWIKKKGKGAENLYQAGDDIWKVYNYTFESNKLRNALAKMTPDQQSDFILRKSGKPMDTDAFIREEAARIVRNTVPNYNLAPEAIKSLRRAPVGNFIAFPYEIMRTGVNTIARGIDELADPNVEIQKIGMRRLMGALTTFSVVPAGISSMGYALSGVSKEEMDAYQRSLAPPWEKNARLVPVGRHEDGTPKYINYSYSNPYDMLERTAIAALNNYEEGMRKGKSSGQVVSEAAFASLGEMMSPFTQESIALAAFRDVLDPNAENPVMQALGQFGRGGKTITGAKIYNPEDSKGDQIAKSFAHIADTLMPSIIPIDESGGVIEPSRFARGFINGLGLNETLGISEEDRMGRERDLSQELARAFSGITESDSQASDSLKYKGYEFARARQDASNIFNSIARRQNVTREQLIEAYNDANEARFRAFRDFNQVLRDVETFGMSRNEMRRILKQAGVSGVNELLRDTYRPLEVSDSVLKDMRRNGTIGELPRGEIRGIISEQRGRQFDAPVVQEEPLYEILPPKEEPLYEILPPLQQEGSIQLPAAATPTRTAAVSPSLLGDNPIDVARNMEIASTQRR